MNHARNDIHVGLAKTSPLYGRDRSAARPERFYLLEIASDNLWKEGYMETSASVDTVNNRENPFARVSNSNFLVVHPVA
jgi:hypothetical protein